MEKRCAHCRELKDESCFHKNRKTKDGLCNYCKTCKHSADGASHKRHRERRLDAKNKYYAEHRTQGSERTKQWKLDNPDHATWGERKQKAKVRGIQWNLSIEWFRENIWDKPCRYCGGEQKGGIDRIDNRLGYEPSNCVPCCTWCNSIKMEHTIDEMCDHLRKMLDIRDNHGPCPHSA